MIQSGYELSQSGELPVPAESTNRDNEGDNDTVAESTRQNVPSTLTVTSPLSSPTILPPIPFHGDPNCPCIGVGELAPLQIEDLDAVARASIGETTNLTSYGFGCAMHDSIVEACQQTPDFNTNSTIEDYSWCRHSWCWIDPDDCSLRNNRAQSIVVTAKDRFYSYSTCRSMDSLQNIHGVRSLAGKTLRVGFNHNTGGWVGAFSEKQRNFEGPIDIWSGPVLEFLQAAAVLGNFSLQLTPPPAFLLNRSLAYFGGSRFSYCVYATALGFLDLCIAQYTITAARGGTSKWIVLGDQPMRLIIFQEQASAVSNVADAISRTFRPFTLDAWLFIVLIVIPILGGLMVLHEYGVPGSSYRVSHQVMLLRDDPGMDPITDPDENDTDKNGDNKQTFVDDNGRTVDVVEEPVPVYRHAVRSMYYAYLSVLKGTYETRVVTLGAYLNLIGISAFILMIFSVYTANLTAIITAEAKQSPIRTLSDVVERDLRICSIRTGYLTIQSLYGNVGKFVRDPVELGGDGQPGFNCPDCNVAQRVFDFLDPVLADVDDRYCHVAITQEQDLTVLHGKGQHCNKTAVGKSIANAQTGIPVSEAIHRELSSFLFQLMERGVYAEAQESAKPVNQCFAGGLQGGGNNNLVGLSIQRLAGIWVGVVVLCTTGLLVTTYRRLFSKQQSLDLPGQWRNRHQGRRRRKQRRRKRRLGDGSDGRDSIDVSGDGKGDGINDKSRFGMRVGSRVGFGTSFRRHFDRSASSTRSTRMVVSTYDQHGNHINRLEHHSSRHHLEESAEWTLKDGWTARYSSSSASSPRLSSSLSYRAQSKRIIQPSTGKSMPALRTSTGTGTGRSVRFQDEDSIKGDNDNNNGSSGNDNSRHEIDDGAERERIEDASTVVNGGQADDVMKKRSRWESAEAHFGSIRRPRRRQKTD